MMKIARYTPNSKIKGNKGIVNEMVDPPYVYAFVAQKQLGINGIKTSGSEEIEGRGVIRLKNRQHCAFTFAFDYKNNSFTKTLVKMYSKCPESAMIDRPYVHVHTSKRMSMYRAISSSNSNETFYCTHFSTRKCATGVLQESHPLRNYIPKVPQFPCCLD